MLPILLATILIATDPHVLAPELHDNGDAYQRYAANAGGRDLVDSTELWEAFLSRALAEKPAVVLLTGDLTNQGERASHLLVAAGLERLRQKGIRALVIPGNHDINNPWARGFQGGSQVLAQPVSPTEFSQIYGHFGYEDALDRDADSLSYLAELGPGLWILMLDSSVNASNARSGYPETRGYFSDETMDWISRWGRKARAAGASLIAAMHHSVADHSPVITEGFTVENADEVASILLQAGVRAVFTGHIHIQDIAARKTSAGTLVDVATNALSVYPNHYGRLTWSQASGALDYQSFKVAAPGSALDIHARSAFRISANRLFPEQGRDMVTTLNENYFSGREDLNQAFSGSPLFTELASDAGFLGRYVRSLVADFDALPDNRLELR